MERRKFIGIAGSGLATTMVHNNFTLNEQIAADKSKDDLITVKLPPLEQPSEKEQAVSSIAMPKDKRIGYAIVGLGNLSLGQILPAFAASKFAKPVALVSGDPIKASKIALQYGIASKNIYDYRNFDDIKNNKEIEAVYIVLPNSLHEEYVIRAAKAGKHVLCEKPMATSVAACQNMIAACKQAGKKLMVAYRIQYEPHNRLAMQWVRDRKFGKVKFIELHNSQNIGDSTQWRLHKALSGGGSLPDIGLYCLNTARFLSGEEPETVMATIYSTPGDIRFKEVEETVLWQLKFPSGLMVNSSSSYGVHQSRRYRCYADNGGWFGLDPAFEYERLQMEASHADGNQEIKMSPTIKEAKQFALEIDHFSECILDDKTPYTPGEEGLQDQKIMDAIYQSAKSGEPVKLERIETIDTFRGSYSENN